MDRKTLLLISALDLWSMGEVQGAQSLWMTLKGYADHNWQVYFITSNKDRGSTYDIHPNIHIIRFDAHWLKRWFRYKKIGFVAGVGWWTLFQFISLFLAIKTIRSKHLKVNVVYAYEIVAVPVAKALSLLLRVPMVSRFQGTILYPLLGIPCWQFRQWDHLLAFKIPADLCIMTNDGTKGDVVLNALRVDIRGVRFWMNGVDKDMCLRIETDAMYLRKTLGIDKETKVLLMVSRLASWKRVDRAIVALPQVLQVHDDVILLIIGDGTERPKLESLAHELQVQTYVRFLGALPHHNLGPYFKIADIFLSLYDLSNVGNPLLEAMTCGKCIITLNVGDTNQLIHNEENGVLLEVEQLPQLGRAICELLSDERTRQILGKKASEFALRHFWTWAERMDKEVSAVEKLISGHEDA